MSASQQVLFAETILAVKKAMKREAYDSDSDDENTNNGNRGSKLKKRARFAKRGKLSISGPEEYKRIVEYGGVVRETISENPPLVDDDGYEVDSEEDDEERLQHAMANQALTNPYADVQIESILAPLTAITNLPNHPTLSRPFTTNTLTSLMHQSNDLMRKENASLWKVKRLVAGFCGDFMWIPCGVLLGDDDRELFKTSLFPELTKITQDALREGLALSTGGVKAEPSPNPPAQPNHSLSKPEDGDHVMANTNVKVTAPPLSMASRSNGPTWVPNGIDHTDDEDLDDDANADNESEDDGIIHPFFFPPTNGVADRNMGLPDDEAEEFRRILHAYVQKQEEVCLGARRLFEGLLKAQRLRRTVMSWSRTEAHSGENHDMSDGEDWYDKEFLGITEDLKKGQDEEEEDTTTTKKTRNRK